MRSQHEHTETQVVEHKAQSERQGTRVGVAMVQRWAQKRRGGRDDRQGRVGHVRARRPYTILISGSGLGCYLQKEVPLFF